MRPNAQDKQRAPLFDLSTLLLCVKNEKIHFTTLIGLLESGPNVNITSTFQFWRTIHYKDMSLCKKCSLTECQCKKRCKLDNLQLLMVWKNLLCRGCGDRNKRSLRRQERYQKSWTTQREFSEGAERRSKCISEPVFQVDGWWRKHWKRMVLYMYQVLWYTTCREGGGHVFLYSTILAIFSKIGIF